MQILKLHKMIRYLILEIVNQKLANKGVRLLFLSIASESELVGIVSNSFSL